MIKTILDTAVTCYKYVYMKINIIGKKLLPFIKVVNSVTLTHI